MTLESIPADELPPTAAIDPLTPEQCRAVLRICEYYHDITDDERGFTTWEEIAAWYERAMAEERER